MTWPGMLKRMRYKMKRNQQMKTFTNFFNEFSFKMHMNSDSNSYFLMTSIWFMPIFTSTTNSQICIHMGKWNYSIKFPMEKKKNYTNLTCSICNYISIISISKVKYIFIDLSNDFSFCWCCHHLLYSYDWPFFCHTGVYKRWHSVRWWNQIMNFWGEKSMMISTISYQILWIK